MDLTRRAYLGDNEWHDFVRKGGSMLAMMLRPLSNNDPPQSDLIANGRQLLHDWGWERMRGEVINLEDEDAKVGQVMRAKGISTESGPPSAWRDWNRYKQRHFRAYRDPETGAYKRSAFAVYEWHFNPGRRVMIASTQFSPRLEPDSDNPRLRRWSDVTFLEWYYNQVGSQQQNGLARIVAPDFIIVPRISNRLSQGIIDSVLDRSNRYYKDWPGETYLTSTEYGRALLACPNSMCIAWFLAAHKRQFGDKYVSEITVFEPDNVREEFPYLAFKVEDAPPPQNV